jgi:CRISPR/Cas system endoribonuclease Cas6 (RAMP superfamily)
MRLHLYLSPNERPVPFDYQHYLTGAFHKWLGANDLHDRLSLYSLSWLYEGRARRGFRVLAGRTLVPERLR